MDDQRLFKKPKKALLIVGSGSRDMNLDIHMPFLYTWGVKDKYANHPFAKGDFGVTGSKNGNDMINEADLIIMIGTRMDSHQVPDWDKFAPNATKVSYCVDFPHSDKILPKPYLPMENNLPSLRYEDWGKKEENTTDTPIYRFIDKLSEAADANDIIIPDMGQTGCIAFQRWKIKEGQRLFNGMNHSPMGYSLPGAIGASLATKRRVIVIIGDGSLMMNIQDLQIISDLKLPINIFVVNNGGYGMIRQTQNDWKECLTQGIACNFKIPDIKKIAEAFNLKYSDELSNEPSIFEVKLDDTTISPKYKMGNK